MVEKLETQRLDVEEVKPPRRSVSNLCVCCGEECPEGRQICYICEHDGFVESRLKQRIRQTKYPKGLRHWTTKKPEKRKRNTDYNGGVKNEKFLQEKGKSKESDRRSWRTHQNFGR